MKKIHHLLVFLLLPLLAIYGCGSSGGPDSGKTNTRIKTGTLSVSAVFPQNGQKGQVGTAYIDSDTAFIYVTVIDIQGNEYNLDLTPGTPSGSISGIIPGEVEIGIETQDSQNNLLDYLNLAGTIVTGDNTLVTTLLRGNWKLKNQSGSDTTITLNKTLASDTATISSFSIIPTEDYFIPLKKSAVSLNDPFMISVYEFLWKGTGFSQTFCGTNTTVCLSDGVSYSNQFLGPTTNANSLDGGMIDLQPTPGYVPTTDDPTNRFAMIAGVNEEGMTFSDQSAVNYVNTRVTGANTIEGTILEMHTKSDSNTKTCKDKYGVTCNGTPNCVITCPALLSQGKKSRIDSKSILKAMTEKQGMKKAAPNSNGCFIDLQTTSAMSIDVPWDLDQDMQYDDVITVTTNNTWTGDACGHPFRATAGKLPQADVNLVTP